MLILLQYAFMIAVLAYVYTCVLTLPGELLYRWYVFLNDLKGGVHNLPWWWKVLVGCEKCFAGQFAFWYFIFHRNVFWFDLDPSFDLAFRLFFFVSITILMTMLLKKAVEKFTA